MIAPALFPALIALALTPSLLVLALGTYAALNRKESQ